MRKVREGREMGMGKSTTEEEDMGKGGRNTAEKAKVIEEVRSLWNHVA